MPPRPALCATLIAILVTQPACVAEIQERCPLFTENKPTPALPRDLAQLDNLIRHRALQMWHDARQLNGSATRSFRIYFGEETLPLVCARIEQARALAMEGRLDAAGRKYQALLVLSQLIELAIAVHATVEYADQVGELSLTLARTQETFGNQFKPLLEAALSEDPRRIEGALRESAPGIQDWLQYLQRWTAHIQADAERMVVAKAAWDITIGVIAAYETAGALAELVAGGGPPVLPFPALGGGAAAMELSGTTYIELAEAIRKLIASGALDAGVVAALSGMSHMSASHGPLPSQPRANAPVPKFSEYIFKEGATHGKDAVFSELGYSREDSTELAKLWEEQASVKYARGEFALGKLDQYGQRIDIEIELHGKGTSAGITRYLRSGWMIQADGSITLNTPFSGYTR